MTSATTRDEDIEMSKTGLLSEEMGEDREMKKESRKEPVKSFRTKLVDGACIALNIASTVLLVFLNNWYVCQCGARQLDAC